MDTQRAGDRNAIRTGGERRRGDHRQDLPNANTRHSRNPTPNVNHKLKKYVSRATIHRASAPMAHVDEPSVIDIDSWMKSLTEREEGKLRNKKASQTKPFASTTHNQPNESNQNRQNMRINRASSFCVMCIGVHEILVELHRHHKTRKKEPMHVPVRQWQTPPVILEQAIHHNQCHDKGRLAARKVALSLIRYLSIPIGGITELSKTAARRNACWAQRRFDEGDAISHVGAKGSFTAIDRACATLCTVPGDNWKLSSP